MTTGTVPSSCCSGTAAVMTQSEQTAGHSATVVFCYCSVFQQTVSQKCITVVKPRETIVVLKNVTDNV